MNKNTKQIIQGAIIFIATLLIGFGITAISFNLFDTLTQNQMRILFTADVMLLIAIGTVAKLIFDGKKAKKKREKKLNDRHNKRIEQRQLEINGIDIIIAKNNFAA